ncbi:MAG: cyclic nucleotide-binding domain-containing protein [Candidatus Latescibacteria bacterium]|nr:cyclic nucleotide-binding domain-containing protein [Candidatus Latescibacterota bacterium]
MINIDFLRTVPLFEGLTEAELKDLSDVTINRTFFKGNFIILDEEEGDSMFVIKSGQVKVSKVSEDGREVILAVLGADSVFGEMALLDRQPRSANVVATEETELVMLQRHDFVRLLHQSPHMAEAMLAELASRLRRTDRQIEGLALLNVTSRISETLLQLAEDRGDENDRGIVISNRPTHQELANMSGTTRETVSRVLKRLESEGYIDCSGRMITIVKDENWR